MSEDPKSPSKNSTKSRILSYVASRETLLFAAISGVSYLGAFYVQAGYLGYFSISGEFVEIDILRIVLSVVMMSSITLTLIFFAQNSPINLLKWVLKIGFIFRTPLFLATFATIILYFNGFTWISVGLFFLSLLALVAMDGISLWSLLSRKQSLQEVLDMKVSEELNYRENIAGGHVSDLVPLDLLLIIFLSLGIIPLAASHAGGTHAKRENHFSTLLIDSNKFVIVATFRNGLLAAEYQTLGAENVLTGRSRFVSTEHLSDLDLGTLSERVVSTTNSTSGNWRTLNEFLNENVMGQQPITP